MNNDNQNPVAQEPLLDEDDDRTTVTLDADDDDTSTVTLETEWDEWEMEDDDRGCEQCSGCAYCQESGGYDGADEV